MANQTLSEKIEKFQKGLSVYQKNKPIKNPNLAHNLALITCCFEFECFLDDEASSVGSDAYLGDLSNFNTRYACLEALNYYFYPWEEKVIKWLREVEEERYHDDNEHYLDRAKEELEEEWNKEDHDEDDEFDPSEDEVEQRADELFQHYLDNISADEIFEYYGYDLEDIVHKVGLEPTGDYYLEGSELYERGGGDIERNYEYHYERFADRVGKVFHAHVTYDAESVDDDTKLDHPDWWFVEGDASLKGREHHEDYVGVEIISEWVESSEATALVEKFKNKIFDVYNGVTNSHCGFHFNLRTKGIIINPVKLITLLGEVSELKKFDRENSRYARQLIDPVLSSYKYHKREQLKAPNLKDFIAFIERNFDKSKFFSVNFGDYDFSDGTGRVEFRIMGNDYLGKYYQKVMETIPKYIYLVAASCEPEAYREDYLLAANRLKGKAEKEEGEAKTAVDQLWLEVKGTSPLAMVEKKNQLVGAIKNILSSGTLKLNGYHTMLGILSSLNQYINIKELLTKALPGKRSAYLLQKITPRDPAIYKAYDKLGDPDTLRSTGMVVELLQELPEEAVDEFVKECRYSFSIFTRKTLASMLVARKSDYSGETVNRIEKLIQAIS